MAYKEIVSYFTAANVVTVIRIPFFAGFVWQLAVGNTEVAVLCFTVAWGLDGIDGWLARRFNQASPLGSLLDKIIDRIILGCTVLLLVGLNYVPVYVLFLLAKDCILLPAWFIPAFRERLKQGIGKEGKIMTFLQGIAILWLLLRLPYGTAFLAAAAMYGAAIAISHLAKISKEIKK